MKNFYYLAVYGQMMIRGSFEPPMSFKGGFSLNEVDESISLMSQLNEALNEAAAGRKLQSLQMRLDAVMSNPVIAQTFGVGLVAREQWPTEDLTTAIRLVGAEIDQWNQRAKNSPIAGNIRHTAAGWVSEEQYEVDNNNALYDFVRKNLIRDNEADQHTQKSSWPPRVWFPVYGEEFCGWGWTTAPADVVLKLLNGNNASADD